MLFHEIQHVMKYVKYHNETNGTLDRDWSSLIWNVPPLCLTWCIWHKRDLGQFEGETAIFSKKEGETAIKLVIWLSYESGNFEIAKLCMYLVVFMEESLCWSRVGGIVFLGLN